MTPMKPSTDSRRLVVDMTPTCVNRTAIYHIALDTVSALEPSIAGLQYRGELGPRPADRDAERIVQQAFFRDVAGWAEESAHTDELDESPEVGGDGLKRLYFDPIYTLYRPLSRSDVVFVLDVTTLTNPEWHNPTVAKVYERAFRKIAASPARIVSISANCTSALRANFAIPSADITTVPLYLRAFPDDRVREPIERLRSRPFFLFVGSLETRKNVTGLIQAFALSGLAQAGFALAIAGGDGEGAGRIREEAGQFDAVELLGFVTDAELAWLYAEATAFVYPSFLEGFGVPLVEAMAYGLPCLASLTGASSEICGDLGVLVDPYDMQSIVEGLLSCVEQSRGRTEADRSKLVERARSYSFDRYLAALTPALA